MRHVKDAIAPNAKAVLGYYRALVQPFGESRSLLFRRTSVPALYLHGADDGCVGSELATGVGRGYASGVDVHVIHDAGHFVHLEQPERVNALLRGFFS
jgi:pimeloyl-ACP methyl ester carboxylesterase